MRKSASILAALALGACSTSGDEEPAGGITHVEEKQLNQAAAQLNLDNPPPRLTAGELPKPPAPPQTAPKPQ